MTLVALDELYNLGIGIKGSTDDLPFWDTTLFAQKGNFLHQPSLAHNSTVLDDLTLWGWFYMFFKANWDIVDHITVQ
jgi:hypothetical protein